MYSATLPYLRNNVKVFDIIKAEKLLWIEYWSVADTQFWESEENVREVVFHFNLATVFTVRQIIEIEKYD